MTLDELSKLSTIDINLLEKLDHVIKYIISDEIVHAVKNNKDVINIELGQIGVLTLNVSNTEVKYNFKPSDEFNKIVCCFFVSCHDWNIFFGWKLFQIFIVVFFN